MDHAENHNASTSEATQRKPRAWSAALLMVALIAGIYLLREHWNHVAGTWPYPLLFFCPLTHLFHGQSAYGKHDSHEPQPAQA